ncbi:MAG: septal ring lytic transglycosylase RlpA family protein [Nitrospira sp.]|nr:septal ring lytic transglycosylase RlpA family protein [Nitrospira sp.]MCA9475445.1 septal ring lytic transglycosylase RlpA family protein [Nitrospira sp.]MCA9479525.1 septal ring lytic transglycosylase RlpA family protein [Nitrospira sp.]MCB9711129.1 septal ring lytic transglycosylase RlpA family protein [Nitrospiraceae bacterium]HQU29606.1 septal ring lytic transglycosylase RlpA family protein [Nitrospirales bacterium]
MTDYSTPHCSRQLSLGLLLASFLVIQGCMGGYHRNDPVDWGDALRGMASWYGPSFHGKPSASGEPYDMWAMTAAHRTLPFGTIVQVKSVETGKSVRVRINDRGPFIRGRIIDLSYAAARELAMIGKGTEEVVLNIVSAQEGQIIQNKPSSHRFWVQAGSFQTLTEAVSFQEQLRPHFSHLRLQTVHLPSGEWHRVQIGAFSSAKHAQRAASNLEKQFDVEPLLLQDN